MRRRLVGTSYTRLEPGLASVLAYLLWVLGGMLMLTIGRESRFVRSHALQSIFCARRLVPVARSGAAGGAERVIWVAQRV